MLDMQDAKECVNDVYLETLPVESGVIILRRFEFLGSYTDISKNMRLTENQISVRVTCINFDNIFYKEGV